VPDALLERGGAIAADLQNNVVDKLELEQVSPATCARIKVQPNKLCNNNNISVVDNKLQLEKAPLQCNNERSIINCSLSRPSFHLCNKTCEVGNKLELG
jgi:hypothetical protein